MLINKREHKTSGLKHFNDSKAFIEYSNDMDDIYKNIEEYNQNKKRKILIVLFIRARKLNISLVFITQSYFAVPKNITLNSTHYFIMKIPNKGELQQTVFNHSSNIYFRDFFESLQKCTVKNEISDSHRLLLNLLDKIDLKRSEKYVALSNLSIYYTWKNIKKSYKNNKIKSMVY